MAKKPTHKPAQKQKAKPKAAAKPKPAHKKPTATKRPPARVMHAAHKAKPVARRPATAARRPTKPAPHQVKGKRKVRSQQLVMAQDYGLTLASIRSHEVKPVTMEPGRKIRMFFVMASPNQ